MESKNDIIRSDLIKQVSDAVPIVQTVSSLFIEVNVLNGFIKNTKKAISDKKSSGFEFGHFLGQSFLFFILLVVCLVVLRLIFNFSLPGSIFWFILIGSVSLSLYLNMKDFISYRNSAKEDELRIKEFEQDKINIFDNIHGIMESPEGIKARNIIPQDYFYPFAVEKMLFYLRNGHADTMKEAVRELDNYMHQKKVEEELRLTRIELEKTRMATEQQSAFSAQQLEQSVELKQHLESVSFWNMYNAYLIENISNKR